MFRIPAGRSEVQGHPWKTGEFDTSMGYVSLCFEKPNGGSSKSNNNKNVQTLYIYSCL